MSVRIGISGWTYAPWRGTFFPKGLRQSAELDYASRRLASIEINGTFYGLQKPSVYAGWAAKTPEGFVFSVKAPRFVTHMKRLRDVEVPVANFFASGPLALGEKLGPILWQLPPQLPYDADRLEKFLRLLPHTAGAARTRARQHDARVASGKTKVDPAQVIRHALEVRHPSFVNPECFALLREHGVALVVADTAGKWPHVEEMTADFVYVRLHGHAELYVSGYPRELLQTWADKINAWALPKTSDASEASRGGRDVYVYFDNDVKTRAPYDAMTLAHLLNLGPAPTDGPPPLETMTETAREHWPA